MIVRYILLLLLFDAVLIDAGVSRPDDVLDSVHSVAIHKHSRCFLAVEDEPQHHRKKQVSQASEEIESRIHSSILCHILVEDKNKLRDGESERDPDVAGSNKRVHFSFRGNGVTARLHLLAQSVNVTDHQSEDQTRDQVCYWAKDFNCFEK